MSEQEQSRPNIVKLNVGGKKFTTTVSTLTQNGKGTSFFTILFNGKFPIVYDDENCIFIDRNGRKFEVILDFLRDQVLTIPPYFTKEEILREAKFYQIEEIIKICESEEDEKKDVDFFTRRGYYQFVGENGSAPSPIYPYKYIAFRKGDNVISSITLSSLIFILTSPPSIWEPYKLNYATHISKFVQRGKYTREGENTFVIHYSQSRIGIGVMDSIGNLHIMGENPNEIGKFEFCSLEE